MSTIPALGARLPALAHPAANPHTDARPAATARKAAETDSDSAISLSSNGIDLEKRLSALGNSTVDLAQSLLGSFAQNLFGDGGKDAAISFDSVSLDAQSSFGVAVQHSTGPNGSTDAAALQLSDSSHFLGKGTITTADGRKFDFEIDIQYSDQITAAAGQTSANGQTDKVHPSNVISLPPTANPRATEAINNSAANGASTVDTSGGSLPTVQFPNIDFPGTLADLFKLIGHDLQGSLSTAPVAGDKNNGASIDRNTLRSLSLRLLSLVDSRSKDTYEAPNSAEARAKSLASSYGVPATVAGDAGTSATSAPAAATTAAATAAAAAAPVPASAAPVDSTPAADGSPTQVTA